MQELVEHRHDIGLDFLRIRRVAQKNKRLVLALLPRAGVKVTINEGFSQVSGGNAGIVPPPPGIK